ncbi:MAG: 2Fe-2S iron-sulfur cluster-binding protein [Candidatus Nanopelagicales bacterium]
MSAVPERPESLRAHQVRVEGAGTVFDVPAGERILAAGRRAGVWLPYECGWGSCSSCKATLVEGSVSLLFEGAPAVDARDERRRRILLCQSTPTSDVVIKPQRVHDGPSPERPTRDAVGRLVDVERLGPSIARFTFELSDASGHAVVAEFRPGQFAILETASGVRRCYSLAGLPGGRQVQFIAKRYDGPGSTALFDLGAGASIPIELPYGDMWLRGGDRPILLAAGGTGISAILALLRQLAEPHVAGGGRRIRVVYGAATPSELVCWDELLELVGRIPTATLHGALVAPEAEWTGHTGFVTHALEDLAGSGDHEDLSTSEAYLAGPPAMVDAVKKAFADLGITLDRTYVDAFG